MRNVIESSDSPGSLWAELTDAFKDGIESENNELAKNILKYATWCASDEAGDKSSETQQAVYCGFLESITYNQKYFPLFKKWFNPDQFVKYKGSFLYALGEKSFKELEDIYYAR